MTFPFQFSFPPHNLVSIFLVSKLFSTQLSLPSFFPSFSFNFFVTSRPPINKSKKIKIFSNRKTAKVPSSFSPIPSHRAFRFQPLKKREQKRHWHRTKEANNKSASLHEQAPPLRACNASVSTAHRDRSPPCKLRRIVGHYAPTKLTPVSR